MLNPLHWEATDPSVLWSPGNVSEAIPGVSTALNWSFIGDATELASSRAFWAIGVLRRDEVRLNDRAEDRFMVCFYGRTVGRAPSCLCLPLEDLDPAASPVFDGVYLQPFMTIEAVSNSVGWIRDECERIGRDFAAIRIVAPLVSAPELPDERARAYMHARMVTYLAQPGMMDVYAKLNGWDPKRAEPVRNHELFQHDRDRVDHHFHREDLMEVAKLVPDEWVYETSPAGPIKTCVDKMRAYKDAGADEICFYGSTPAENSGLIRAWREHTTAPEAVAGPQVARR